MFRRAWTYFAVAMAFAGFFGCGGQGTEVELEFEAPPAGAGMSDMIEREQQLRQNPPPPPPMAPQ